MFKYRVVKEIPREFGLQKITLTETTDKKKIKEKIPKEIEEKIKKEWKQQLDQIRNAPLPVEQTIPVVYTVFETRVPLFDPQNPPDEMEFLEIEYYPFQPLLAELKKKTGKGFDIDIQDTLRIGRTGNKRILFKYEKEKGWKPLFTTTRKELFPYLEALFSLSKQWRRCMV